MKAKRSQENIDYRKLFVETMIGFCLVLVACVICVNQSIATYGVTVNKKYGELREIVDNVKDHDYRNGRDYELEKSLDAMFSNARNTKAKTFYYGLARAIYYCNIGYYNTANDTFEQIESISVDDEQDMMDRDLQKVLCERKQANE